MNAFEMIKRCKIRQWKGLTKAERYVYSRRWRGGEDSVSAILFCEERVSGISSGIEDGGWYVRDNNGKVISLMSIKIDFA